MLNRNTLEKLHNSGIINKNNVLWWQLGFEGRKVYSLDEFISGIEHVPYEECTQYFDSGGKLEGFELKEKEASVWTRDDVPILIQDISLFEKELPCFITVKPMSHDCNEGWASLSNGRLRETPKLYHQPHVRGLVLEVTDDFMFWYALGNPAHKHGPYASGVLTSNDETMPPVLLNPIPPTDFYSNLISTNFKIHRKKRKGTSLNLENGGLTFVPYYEFESNPNQVTIYPANINPSKLDVPILVKGGLQKPQILGAVTSMDAYSKSPSFVNYRELDPGLERKAKYSLIERLGRI